MVTVSARLDTLVVDELEQYIVNDRDMSKNYDLILKGFAKKIDKGDFDKSKAMKSLVRLVNDGATKYRDNYGTPDDKWQKMFPLAERKAVAESLINTFLMENNMKATATDKSEETGNLISKFGKFDIAQCKKAIESGDYEGSELDFITKKLKAMEDMKDGGLATKSASMPRVILHTKGQFNFQSVNMNTEIAKMLAELQAKKDITSEHDKIKNEVAVECKNDEIYQDIMKKSNALSSKSNEEFDFMSLADDVTENCPMKSNSECDKEDLMAQANDLGLTHIIASEISEKTGNLISKFGKMKYDECKKAIESGEYDGDDLDFLTKKLAGMDRMKSGVMAGNSSKAMGTSEDVLEDKVSDIIPTATSFTDEKSIRDIIPTAQNF